MKCTLLVIKLVHSDMPSRLVFNFKASPIAFAPSSVISFSPASITARDRFVERAVRRDDVSDSDRPPEIDLLL